MHLILTHEQADFDALASLFGASILDERTVPVLPRRINRNVRSFITLYGVDFSFVDPRDLPQGKVESVTLVDTQALITLKGMGPKTTVRVVDHHPLRSGLPDDWQVTIEEIGATTTMLVEVMQVQNERLSSIQATLLLLGIYEDTGSLTYSRTTPRDARAAAWLLENGASLKIAADFLNPPLSANQRKLYEELLENTRKIIRSTVTASPSPAGMPARWMRKFPRWRISCATCSTPMRFLWWYIRRMVSALWPAPPAMRSMYRRLWPSLAAAVTTVLPRR
jgi:tRNA nucleotidyltransferase (CCA-adding enzyme)